MKKILFTLSLVSILFVACKKEDTVQPSQLTTEERLAPLPIAVPSSFTQKMLIEMLSTVHCATCPDAEQKYRNIAAAHPDRVYGISIHNSDAMETPLYNFIDSVFTIPYYASGMLNRTPFGGTLVLPKGNWNANINSCLNKTASCGLKINSSISGNNATVDVFAGFNTFLPGNYNLTVYLFENGVSGTGSGYNQANYYNSTTGSPFFGLGNPIIGYQHDFVQRQVLTSNIGDVIHPFSGSRNACIKRSFNFNISGYNASQLYVIAFINKVGNTSTTHEVMNVQQTKLGTNKNFD